MSVTALLATNMHEEIFQSQLLTEVCENNLSKLFSRAQKFKNLRIISAYDLAPLIFLSHVLLLSPLFKPLKAH